MALKRRDLLLLAGIAGFVWAVPRVYRAFQPPFEFADIRGLPGWRYLAAGPVSGGNIALLGIDTPSEAEKALRADIANAPCSVFEGGMPGAVPVAVFSDYNCPTCPETSEDVIELMEAGAPIHVSWHDLPILGPRSVEAARVAISADDQGAYLPVHRHLMRSSLRPGPAAMRALATEFDLDPDRLVEGAASARTSERINRANAAAAVFGLAGTPSMIVGRTIVVGRLRKQSLVKLIEIEREEAETSPVCS